MSFPELERSQDFYNSFAQFLNPQDQMLLVEDGVKKAYKSKCTDTTSPYQVPSIIKHEGSLVCCPTYFKGADDSKVYSRTENAFSVASLTEVFRKTILQAKDSPSKQQTLQIAGYTQDPWKGMTIAAGDTVSCRQAYWELLQPKLKEFLSTAYGITWEERSSPTEKSVVLSCQGMNRHLWKHAQEGKDVDVTIKTSGDKTMGAHESVLSKFSPYFDGLDEIQFPEDELTVKAFLSFAYLKDNPFISQGVNAIALFGIAERYKIDDLIKHCISHFQRSPEYKWEDLGDIGILYCNKAILEEYEKMRNSRPLTATKRMIYKQLGITPCSIEVQPQCDVGFGNTLGIRFAPKWDTTTYYKCENGKWRGEIPLKTEFKFVKVLANGKFEWEKGNNRVMASDDGKPITVQF